MNQSAKLHHPQTRAGRLAAIRTAIESVVVTSQQQLSQILSEQGFDVTQATLSRDLDELKAFKARNGQGVTSYMLPKDSEIPSTDAEDSDSSAHPRMTKVLSGLVTSVATASNQAIIHTPSGAAQYVASVIDSEPGAAVLGTIAGDDTVLIILSSESAAQEYSALLLDIASGSTGNAETSTSANE